MTRRSRWLLSSGAALLFAAVLAGENFSPAGEPPSKEETNAPAKSHGPRCVAVDHFFADEVWAKVGERVCLNCHTAEGDAADSSFILQDPARHPDALDQCLARNRAAFGRMAAAREGGRSRLLLKVTGGLDHGGGEVLKPDSTGYRILERFVRRLSDKPTEPAQPTADEYDAPPFFRGIEMLPPPRLLRRVTLSLAARLPSPEERKAVEKGGLDAMDAVLDQIMTEDAFYERLKEGFNDIFLTAGGYEDVPENILSYAHFSKTRHWYQKFDLSDVPKEDRQKARWKLADVYREAFLREPMELIEYIVRNDRPFTELVTADYIMVSPYTARGYGIYDELRDQFKDPDDPFEYIPAKLRALKSRNGKVQESATGYYPHSGMLTSFHYLQRYPTTATNRNRKRARMYYEHFLGIDVMQLAPRVSNAAAITAEYEIPTMQAAECVVCHKTIDPIAGLFQDYDEDGDVMPRKEGWYTDMFGPGWEGTDLPSEERWRALQWLGRRTAQDPRFAVAMVEHVYYILMGREVPRAPQDIDNPLFASRRRAYEQQREAVNDIAGRFAEADFNLKVVFKAWVASKFYRADGLAAAVKEPRRRAELEDVGLVRLLTPEQLERKLQAIFGEKWGRLDDQFKILYGGINSASVTERITEPSGAMGAIQRMMSNEMACKNVAVDFTTPPEERRLFPHIELDVVPGASPEADKKIREAIVYLHQYLLGRRRSIDHPEVERTYALFAGIVADAKAREGLEDRDIYFCRGRDDKRVDDPHYTLRAWRAVVTYLLRQQEFLYE